MRVVVGAGVCVCGGGGGGGGRRMGGGSGCVDVFMALKGNFL